MGKTLWRAVVAGGAAILFTGVAAVPAGAAEGGVSFTRVAVNGGKPIVVGVKEEIVVHAAFRMTTTLTYDSGPTVYPFRGARDAGETLHSAIGGSDCKVVDKANGICDFEEWLYIDPRDLDFGNHDAGTWGTAARVFLAGDAWDTDDENLPLQVKRATRVTVNASPEPVATGKTITVRARHAGELGRPHVPGVRGPHGEPAVQGGGRLLVHDAQEGDVEQYGGAQDHGDGHRAGDVAVDVLRELHLRGEVVDRGLRRRAIGDVRAAGLPPHRRNGRLVARDAGLTT